MILPPLPPGVVLPPEVFHMLAQAQEMQASPPDVPNEVCRYNTVRVPLSPVTRSSRLKAFAGNTG